MQTAVIAMQICLSVCPSVRHVPVFCPNDEDTIMRSSVSIAQ